MQVARQFLIYKKRPGGQSQFSELLQSQTLTSTAFENLHVWISNNLGDERLNVDLLAEHVGMSPRNFARSYKAKTGRTPAKAVEVFRLEAARRACWKKPSTASTASPAAAALAMRNGCAPLSSAIWRYRHATTGAGSQRAQ